MKIGITLNEVVRGFRESVKESYESRKRMIETSSGFSRSDMSKTPIEANHNQFIMEEITEEDERILLKLSPSEDSFRLSTEFKFIDKEEYEDFLYNEYAFDIFSRANLTYDKAMEDLNKLYSELANDKHEVTIFSQERNVSKQATLLFLAQNKWQCNNLKFLYDYSKAWDLYDLIITANPYLIATKPKDKICFKINCEWNQPFECEHSFDDLSKVKKFYRKNKRK